MLRAISTDAKSGFAPQQSTESQATCSFEKTTTGMSCVSVGFLKTHKCASSSVQNILMRFALKNQLNLVLPSAGNYLGRYVPYSKVMVANTPWDRVGVNYDIFCLHTIWNHQEVEERCVWYLRGSERNGRGHWQRSQTWPRGVWE